MNPSYRTLQLLCKAVDAAAGDVNDVQMLQLQRPGPERIRDAQVGVLSSISIILLADPNAGPGVVEALTSGRRTLGSSKARLMTEASPLLMMRNSSGATTPVSADIILRFDDLPHSDWESSAGIPWASLRASPRRALRRVSVLAWCLLGCLENHVG